MSMNPFDEIALEEAIRLKEKQIANEIVLLSIGEDACQDILRHGLALGADRAILIQTDQAWCSLSRAQMMQAIVKQEAPDLVLMGKQAIDDDNNQCAQMLAALMHWPALLFVSKLTLNPPLISATREIDQGLEEVQARLPAVVSADLRLNQPRYASLPNIMKAKQKPLTMIPLASLGLDLKPHVKTLALNPPEARVAGLILNSVAELVDKLQHEAQVL